MTPPGTGCDGLGFKELAGISHLGSGKEAEPGFHIRGKEDRLKEGPDGLSIPDGIFHTSSDLGKGLQRMVSGLTQLYAGLMTIQLQVVTDHPLTVKEIDGLFQALAKLVIGLCQPLVEGRSGAHQVTAVDQIAPVPGQDNVPT